MVTHTLHILTIWKNGTEAFRSLQPDCVTASFNKLSESYTVGVRIDSAHKHSHSNETWTTSHTHTHTLEHWNVFVHSCISVHTFSCRTVKLYQFAAETVHVYMKYLFGFYSHLQLNWQLVFVLPLHNCIFVNVLHLFCNAHVWTSVLCGYCIFILCCCTCMYMCTLCLFVKLIFFYVAPWSWKIYVLFESVLCTLCIV